MMEQSPCRYRQQDLLTGAAFCPQAASDSQTSFVTEGGRGATCASCPVPTLQAAWPCRWLDLMTVITPLSGGNQVTEVKFYCRNDDVRLTALEGCTAEQCRAFQPRA